jgi:adenylate cyclase
MPSHARRIGPMPTEAPLPVASPRPRSSSAETFRWWPIVLATLLGPAAGIAYAAALDGDALRILRAALAGLLIANGVMLFELLVVEGRRGQRLQRAPFALFLAVRELAWVAIIVAALALVQLLVPLDEPMRLTTRAGIWDVVYSFAVSFLAVSLLAVTRLLGPGVLGALVSGRYYRPRSEARVLVWLDMVGSTALAERAGDDVYLAALNRVLQEVTPLIRRRGGSIHRYVGDAVIATWPASRPEAAASAAVACALDCVEAVERRVPEWRRELGAAASLRAAVHMGSVIAAEIGSEKREIAFVGDAMNTLARIEQEGKARGRAIVASAAVLAAATLPPARRVERVGAFTPRGKHDSIELYALEPAA